MLQQNGNSAADERAQAVLDEVILDRFTAEPHALAPFETATLRWQVSVPRDPEVAVSILLDGAAVALSGALPVSPPHTATYRLTARAGRRSKLLGTATVQINLAACITKEDNQVPKWVAGAITEKIQQRTDGIHLKTNPVVTITPDRMNLHLVLTKSVNNFPDPTITIDASFGLALVPGPPPATVHPVPVPRPGVLEFPPVLAAVSKDISTDVSFPWYAWLVPGAMIGLPIAISGAEGDAYRSADAMIDQIVSELLNGFFATPPNMYKHYVALYVDEFGGEFAVTFCPAPEPVVKGEA